MKRQPESDELAGARRVEWVAGLARLQVSPAEAQALGRDLDGVLDHVSALQALDTEGVAGFVPEVAAPDPWRADEVVPGLDRAEALAAAPAAQDGQLWVPRIVSDPGAGRPGASS